MLARVLKIFGWVFLGTCALALMLWIFPSLLFNGTTLNWAARGSQKMGVWVQWEQGSLSAHSLSFTEKVAQLSLKNLCFSIPSIGVEGCLETLQIAIQGRLHHWRPELTSLGPVKIIANRVTYSTIGTNQIEGTPNAIKTLIQSFQPPNWLSSLHPKELSIVLNDCSVQSRNFKAKGIIQISANEDINRLSYDALFKGTITIEDKIYTAKANAWLKGTANSDRTDWQGVLSVEGKTGRSQILSATLRAFPKATELRLEIETRYRNGNTSMQANLNAEAGANFLRGEFTGSANEPFSPFSKLAVSRCQFSWNGNSSKDTASLNCPVNVTFSFNRSTDLPYSQLFKTALVKVKINLEQTQSSKDSPITGTVTASVDPLFSLLKDGRGVLSMNISGKLAEFPKKWHYEINSEVHLANFKRLTAFLSKTSWAIPEPLNGLDGTVMAHIKGKGIADENSVAFPLTVETKLSSAEQRLFLTILSEIRTNPMNKGTEYRLQANVLLKDVQLVLPPIELQSPPRIFPDSRIQLKAEPRSLAETPPPPDSKLLFNFNFATPEGQTVKLISNVAKEAIPLKVRLKLNSQGETNGYVLAQPFALQLFNRNAKVNYLNLTLNPDPEKSEIQAKIEVFYSDYTITILIDGLLSKPQIHMISDPPLPEKQVVAILFFGRSLDQLDSDEINSVGNASSAIADGAIGLASLYALASTPVESVGYAPSSRVFTAKIRLANGTSLNIGTDLSKVSKLGFRKRLGPHWNINTYLENPFMAADRSLTTFLEWNWRY